MAKDAQDFNTSTPDVDAAVQAAEEAFWSFGYSSRDARARLLTCIAENLEARRDKIVTVCTQESHLPQARLEGELGRTCGQLRMFADHILKDGYLDLRHDPAMPDRSPLPRPDLHLVQRPIGPVAVFGASNFPLAFSTAGGDTASALAAGCPVVVKGHESHPETSAIVAEAIQEALKTCDMHPGTFGLVQGTGHAIGAELVQHPLIKAVGFTGSLRGGRALYDLCAARPEPIPFFGELGSVNPVFVMDNALFNRGDEIAEGWAASLTMGVGQFCTNPGVVVLREGPAANRFVDVAKSALDSVPAQTMLNEGIAKAYRTGQSRLEATKGVTNLLSTPSDTTQAGPALFATNAQTWQQDTALREEVFGPLGLIVTAASMEEVKDVAKSLEGQLTCTLMLDDDDIENASELMPVLERKAGRVLANGFPTGVEVSDAMVHGGPYPASTNFGATSVGTMAIRRFLRPVCYQNLPETLRPNVG